MNLLLDFSRSLIYGIKTGAIVLFALIAVFAFAIFLLFVTAWVNEKISGPSMVVGNILQNTN